MAGFFSPLSEPVEPFKGVLRPPVIAAPSELRKPSEGPHEAVNVVLERIPKQLFASLQDYLRRMLFTGDPTLANPWNIIQAYSICFTKTRLGSQAEISVSGAFPTMLATVQFKLAQGATFKACARKDCRLPFEVSSRHKRRFCTQYCAHITSLRKRRKLQRTITLEGLHSKGR